VSEIATTKHTQIAGYNNSWETIKGNLERFVPNEVDRRKISEQAFFLVRKNPKLLDCNLESFAAFLIRANSLRLDPLIPNMCWPIPRKGEVTFQYGYLGLRELAMRSGKYRNVFAHAVYDNDEFVLEYISGKIVHSPGFKDRGELLCVYAVAIDHKGYADPEMMTIEQVRAIQKRSAGVNKGRSTPWDTDWDEMARKTVLKRLCKRLDLSAEAARALSEEDPPIQATTSAVVDLDALPTIQASAPALPADDPPPVEDATEVPQHDFAEVPKLGSTTISKCLQRGIDSQSKLYDVLGTKQQPSGMRSVTVQWLKDKFAPRDDQDAAAMEADPPTDKPADTPAPPALAELVAKLVAGRQAGMMDVDIIHADLLDSGIDADQADALIGSMVKDIGHVWAQASDLDTAKLWRKCRDEV
jgi:recombination protein RecT